MPVRLLVSVRNSTEAAAAVDSGADIVDVKEPNRGSLGFAGAEVIRDVAQTVGDTRPVSAALGEASEWQGYKHAIASVAAASRQRTNDELPACRSLQDRLVTELRPPRPLNYGRLNYVKMGLAHSIVNGDSTEWRDKWLESRSQFEAELGGGDSFAPDLPSWVAVAYADYDAAACPAPQEILDAAVQTNCAGFLIDTFTKGNGSTLDLMAESDLITLRRTANAAGMFFALAGQITDNHLPAVRRISPDIVAVRGAVCKDNDRRATICQRRLTTLKKELLKI